MTIKKPYHRNYRAIKPNGNSGYSDWAYIVDPEYAQNAAHYVRALILIQRDLESIFEYLEPSEESQTAYSYRVHALLMRTCIEVEANFRAILKENICSTPPGKLNMQHYKKVEVTHHLSSYEAMLPIWNVSSEQFAPKYRTFRPFESWKSVRGAQGTRNSADESLDWYQAYNASKHNRHDNFKKANLENLVLAVAGLLILVSSQFRDENFSAGSTLLAIGQGHYPMQTAIGNLFRIKYPSLDDWTEDKLYEFNWSDLEKQKNKFEKINYDDIQV
ncbi:MAG: hypothetical protein OXH88_01355 [Gammaproteobacteria bacterium]|nr:hypothetical protein [Gammaproteobacteria bacterium]